MLKKKQLDDGYVRLKLSFFSLLAKFYAYCCSYVKVTTNNKVERFLSHSVICNIFQLMSYYIPEIFWIKWLDGYNQNNTVNSQYKSTILITQKM